ncbi:hypothetical protein FS749_011428 [Ceratobasidium sp. UAMH 11750]|nr:hypothetical protein FS749_011428 [Ceratobasidium sp. UAMH 11750]
MSLDCPYCRAGLACKEHPNAPRPPLPFPSNQALGEPETPSKLPKAFKFYQPSQPVTLSKPWSEHSSSERAHIVSTHPPVAASNASDNAKRKLEEDTATDAPSTSKRQATEPQTFGVIQPASRQLRSAAYDVYRCAIGCDTKHAPAGINFATTVEEDAAYQQAKPRELFRRPLEKNLRCIYCL